jgi:hypothetical protein
MLRRTTVAALVAVGGLLLGAGPAAAQGPSATAWDDAAASADFPVYRPTRTLGLTAAVDVRGCLEGTSMVAAEFGPPRSRKGPRFAVWQAQSPCGNPGLSLVYRKVRIHGRTVQLRASCEVSFDPCTLKPGRKHSWLLWLRFRGGEDRKLTVIEMFGRGMTAKRFLRVARSLRRVDLARPVVHLTRFLSPDEGTWCLIGTTSYDTDARCATESLAFGGTVTPGGTVTLCANEPWPCFQNWDAGAPVLRDGQRSRVAGFECAAQDGAIKCTVTGGVGKGKGFRLDRAGVSEIGPAP